MKDHVHIEELYAARALAGLDPAEAVELERVRAAHGECRECGRLETEYEEVAGRLAFALTPAGVPDGMEDRIVGERRGRVWRGTWQLRRVAMAAAAALLLVAGGLGGYLLAPEESSDLVAAASYVSEPGTRVASLEGSGRGHLAIAFRPGEGSSYLIGSGLPTPPSGKVYELWLMRGAALTPAATFSSEGDVLVVRIPSDASTAALAAVTLERAPGAEKPTMRPIYETSIS